METLEYLHTKASDLVEANKAQGLEFPYSGDAPLRMKKALANTRKEKETN